MWTKLKYRLLHGFILLVLFLPMLQYFFPFVKEEPLMGSYWWAKDTAFTWCGWWDGSYQEKKEVWINENFGFRNTCVRLRNQIGWELYDMAYTNGVVKGKNGVLMDRGHMEAYFGTDLISKDTLQTRMNWIRDLNEYLKDRGAKLLVVVAPGKGTFYAESVPEQFRGEKGRTNREQYCEAFKKEGISYIDFSSWFEKIKDTCRFTLFPKGGIHWSEFGAIMALDSMMAEMGRHYKDSFPDLRIDLVEWREELSANDKDIAVSMNLLFPLKLDSMPYGFYSAPGRPTQDTLLVIADSYFWTVPYWVLKDRCFKEVNFLFYNKHLHRIGTEGILEGDAIDRRYLLRSAGYVILLTTEANLKAFPWNFWIP